MKIYLVKHEYDLDGGFGDAVGTEETICVVDTKEKAELIQKELSNYHVYEEPYQCLMCGRIIIEEISVLDNVNEFVEENKKNAWWMQDSDMEKGEEDDEI